MTTAHQTAPRAAHGERRTQIVRAVARLLDRAKKAGTAAEGIHAAQIAAEVGITRKLAGTLLSIYTSRGLFHHAGPRNDMRYFLERDAADAYARRIGSERVVVRAPLRQMLAKDAPVLTTAKGVRHTVAPVCHDYRFHVPRSFEGELMADWHARRSSKT